MNGKPFKETYYHVTGVACTSGRKKKRSYTVDGLASKANEGWRNSFFKNDFPALIDAALTITKGLLFTITALNGAIVWFNDTKP